MAAPAPCPTAAAAAACTTSGDDAAVARLQRYLRMKTVHPDPTPGYREVAALMCEYADAVSGSLRTEEYAPGHPIYIITILGTDPSLTTIALSSHMDVVPVEVDKWTVDPWAGEMRHVGDEARIYGRGTQDMKSMGIAHLEAVARWKAAGAVFRRTIHVLFVPDEEVGGNRGMKLLLGHNLMRELNVGFVLDEGLATPGEAFPVFYGERKIWWLRLRAEGPTGHGSRFIPGTAVQKLLHVANALMGLHAAQAAEYEAACGCGKKTLGDFTTANLTMLHAGDHTRIQYNVVPTVAEAGFDLRIPATVDLTTFAAQLDAWCAEAGSGVSYELVSGTGDGALDNPTSDISPDSYWWGQFQAAATVAGIPLAEPSIFPAATDSRWIRLLAGIPCFGFSPLRRMPVLLHDHDEYVTVSGFCEAIAVLERMLPVLANADAEPAAPTPPPPRKAASPPPARHG